MERTQKIIVMTREELIALIEEVIFLLRKMDNHACNSHREDGAATQVYTTNEVAGILKCSPKNIATLIRKKILHASMFNRQYCIGEKSLRKFILQNTLLLHTNRSGATNTE